jgi:hypothetical protein
MYPYGQSNQTQGLPFNPEAPQLPYLNLTLNNPPYVPNYQGEPWARQLAPLVAAAAAIEIQQRAPTNPLRMFMFNQHAQNNFANPDFDGLVTGILDFVSMGGAQGRYRTPEEGVQDAVPKIIEMVCVSNVRNFPALERYLDPNMVPAMRNTINLFDNVVMEINAFKRSRSGGGWNQGGGQPYVGGGGAWGGAPSGHFGTGRTDFGIPPMVPRAGHGGTTGLFGGGGPAQPFDFRGSGSISSDITRYGKPLEQPFAQKDINMGNPVPGKEENASTEIPAKDVNWRPGKEYPYYPAYNPRTHELFFKLNQNNEYIPVFKNRDQNAMDYNRHRLPSVFGPIPRNLELDETGNTLKAIEEGIKQVSVETTENNKPENDGKDLRLTHVKQQTIVESCEKTVWFLASLDRLSVHENTKKIPFVYRAYAQISDPIVTINDDAAFVTNLGASRTFIELKEKMMAAVNEVGMEVWNACNRKITRMINRIINQNISIPGLSIDSFVDDIEDLQALLARKYGEEIREAFLKNQAKQINATLMLMYEPLAKQFTDSYMEDYDFEADRIPSIIYLASNYSLTYLNCHSYELELELAPNVGAAVVQSMMPVMHQMLDELFRDTDARSENFARHLIRTNDGRILEAARGQIGEGIYVLTLIH